MHVVDNCSDTNEHPTWSWLSNVTFASDFESMSDFLLTQACSISFLPLVDAQQYNHKITKIRHKGGPIIQANQSSLELAMLEKGMAVMLVYRMKRQPHRLIE